MRIWRKPFFPINWKFLSLDIVSSLKSTLEGYYCTLKVGKIFCGRHQSYLVEIMIQNTLSLSQGPMAIRAGFTLLFIYKFLILLLILSFETSRNLWSKDAVGRVPHWSPTQGATSDVASRRSVPHLSPFFFFPPHRISPTWLDSHRTRQIRSKSSRIGWIGLYQSATKTDQNGRNRPKSALNHARTAKIGFEWGPNILNLSLLNFILNICCFFCVFFFVLCFVVFLAFFFLCFVNQGIVMCFLRIF